MKCPVCDGIGMTHDGRMCQVCEGTGNLWANPRIGYGILLVICFIIFGVWFL